MSSHANHIPIDDVQVAAYKIPTASPESDGTIAWDQTTLVVVHIGAGGRRGVGYTYGALAAATLVHHFLGELLKGCDAMAIPQCWQTLVRAVRNVGRPGISSMAISAIDIALWDLKARLLEVPLITLLGAARDGIPIYGSGGFTSYSDRQLCEQLGGWASQGITMVKMKVGRDAAVDVARVRAARQAIGPQTELFVDANGGYERKQALRLAADFAESAVRWFEEPVSSDDLTGLRLLRDRAPADMVITAGEYGFDAPYFQRMLAAEAVDVLQADATRCGGITGFLQVGALCEGAQLPLSAHCAPSIHSHLGCALPRCCHIEYFFDHARIEQMLFDGVLMPQQGTLVPDRSRPGLGIELKTTEAKRFVVHGESR